jgi:aminoglycoside 6'-N-acetyltransferase
MPTCCGTWPPTSCGKSSTSVRAPGLASHRRADRHLAFVNAPARLRRFARPDLELLALASRLRCRAPARCGDERRRRRPSADAKRSSRPLWQCSSGDRHEAGSRTDSDRFTPARSSPTSIANAPGRCGAVADERRVVAGEKGSKAVFLAWGRLCLPALLQIRAKQFRMSMESIIRKPKMLMQVSLSFRPLSRFDFPLLQEWLSAPHVAAWWHEPLDLASVYAKYGPRVDGVEPTHVFVIEQDGRPVGWIQWYLWSDYPEHASQLRAELGSAGIDLAIGERAMTGLGWGPTAICEFLRQIVFADLRVSAVIADPEEDNLRSLRAFKKAGFTETNTVQLAGENFKRRVVRINRPQT